MLKGKLVTLRAIEREDSKALYELEKNVELVLHGNGTWSPMPLASFEKRFEKHLEITEKLWFVIEVEGVVIGSIGLHHTDQVSRTSEFGIAVYHPDYVGKGYGSDAIQVLLRWAFRIQNYRRIWLMTDSNNPRAIAAYEKCGFVHEGRLREHVFNNGQYVDVLQMGMLRSEWEAKQKDKG
ncbi:GNAT family N-acetyltransferase [Herpetosiphon giganteus]|uniref:GNAT family N-acetyltransferase n=1 Tax=Herpetosiphon giganteus TaxID=2029754 RepID=UPI00195B08D1|nr:RimJ/RimL family protein N-acetyltransferase [Herpetosiphon giganteus]